MSTTSSDTLVDQEDSLPSEDITIRQSRVAKAMESTMPPTPLPVSPTPSLPSTPSPCHPLCTLFLRNPAFIQLLCLHLHMVLHPQLSTRGRKHTCSAPATEGAPKGSTEGTILSTSLTIPPSMQAKIHVKYGPFQEVICLHSSLGFN